MLLLLGSMGNKAWADTKKVTYHVITLPFGGAGHPMATSTGNTEYRIEAIKATVTQDDTEEIKLPSILKSPLMKYEAYSYFTGATKSDLTQIFPKNDSKFYHYTFGSATDVTGKKVSDLTDTDVYVTYDWADTNKREDYGKILDLNGGKTYNIEFQSNTGTGHWFYAMNMNEERGNRGQAIPASQLNDLSDLCDDGPVTIKGNVDKKTKFYFQWKLINNDPYNIILQTAYTGDFTYKEDGYWKNSVGAQFFGSLESSSKSRSNWVTNEMDKSYTSTSGVATTDRPGWYRGKGAYGRAGVDNGTINHLYFSFTILAHPTAAYTLAASYVDVDGDEWVPSNTGQYLLMDHSDVSRPYAGPKLKTLETADQIRLHEIRDYTYKVKTPFYDSAPEGDKPNHLLSADLKRSDYGKDSLLIDYVPESMKRKYTSIDGTYADAAFETERATFLDLYKPDEQVKRVRDVWLKYSVSSSIPFEAGNSSTTFDNLKWYNIYVNKEEKYTTWYDTSGNVFNTLEGTSGHSKYGHDAHFAFIGDPYELYVVNRLASETDPANPVITYLKLAATEANALTTGTTRETGDIWEIIYDNNTGDYAGCFRLRKFKSYAAPVTIGWAASPSERPLNGDGSGGSTMARLSVLELPLMTYTYYIVDKSNRIAVMAKEEQITGTVLNYESIPEVIRSPFLYGGTLEFKTYASASMATVGEGMTVDLSSEAFTTITNTNSVEANEYQNHIFVSYTTLPALSTTPLTDDDNDAHSFNVLLNNKYIYYDGGTIKSKADFIGGDSSGDMINLWVLGGGDPYAMIIRNRGAGSIEATDAGKEKYVRVTNWADGTITWVANASDATKFIIKSSTNDGYEVMATTSVAKDGSNKIDVANSTDASTTYYNIGRPDDTTVKMFSNATYAHGYEEIRFKLEKSTATQVTYHLIDIARKELLTETARHSVGDKPQIPSRIFSPLVGYANYTYWRTASTNSETKIVTCSNQYGANDKFESSVPANVYITYVANNLVDMNHTTMYLLKYEQGEAFRQENGSDGLLPAKTQAQIDAMTEEQKAAYYKEYQAVYPYCNGDGNFFVYGQKQYELQQEGAASTRTRWAWYVESSNNDPYHVKILSRQTETYDGLERSAYFATRTFDDYEDAEGNHPVVTALVWPNISGVQANEYMVLGNVGQYQLVTTPVDKDGNGSYLDEGEDERYVVNSFEQYWKTYDTVKKKLLSDLLPLCEEKERTDRTDGSILVPTNPKSLRERLTGTGSDEYGFHSYIKMAKAKRWNGYNASGAKSKGWESIEHWFQTVSMGSGYFDLIPTTIDPALILLDQHGWEIMRKPLPSGPDDPDKAHKYEVLGSYDSPMVKEYIFWASASKRSGFHQYYKLDKRIGGSDFSSNSLTSLPPWGSENVQDAKGNHYDHYVTYIVKEEYATSYNPSTKAGAQFLISQGEDIAKKGETKDKYHVGTNPGSTSQYIIDHVSTLNNELWYVKPNADIDTEMGYGTTSHNWTDADADNPNAYDLDDYKDNQVASVITDADDVKKYGRFSFSNGFDPYNIQISSKNDAKYFTMAMTSAYVEEGGMYGDYTGTGGSTAITLADKTTTTVQGNGYDNSKWAMTNQTFMAVQDAEGNMQLMPRFDHNLRMRDFGALVTPTAEAGDKDKLKETITYLYRPFVYNYRIIDNDGHESLRYQSGGDLLPQTPDHFKSPLAKDFKYYKNLTYTTDTYTEIPNGTDISSKEITASLAGAGLTTPSVTDGNIVYVRYTYDEEADAQKILLGKWLTMKLNEKDAQYSGGIVTGTKPATSPTDDLMNSYAWHWKFLKNPYNEPDPYAVKLFNRQADQKDKPMSTATLADGIVTATTDGTDNYYQRFALLSHTEESEGKVVASGYALAVAGTKNETQYYFLDGTGLAAEPSTLATTALEENFKGSTCSFNAKKSKIQLTDDINNTFTYHIYTNDKREAISDTQSQYEAVDNGFVPKLPDAIKTPMLDADQFRYYEALTDTAYNSGKALTNLYGLYDGNIYVRYNAYDPSVSEYKVPNERNNPAGSDPVAKGDGSNDAPLRLDNVLPYNIIWHEDNMMKDNSGSIGYTADNALVNDVNHSWTFEGDDPYAIKIRHKNTNKYVHQKTDPATDCDLNASATTFMLLKREGFEYGVLATTGDKTKMLTEHGDHLTASDTDPTKFIIFSLGTLKVVYHLVLANIGQYEAIPHRERNQTEDENYRNTGADCWNKTDGYYADAWDLAQPNDTIRVNGTTMRELSNTSYQLGDVDGVSYPALDGTPTTTYYCKDVGPISLGDALTVPEIFYRPNVNYFFVVRDIRDDVNTPNTALNIKYKGLQITSEQMSMNEDLIGKIIYIDIVYRFNADLESNNGDNFVMSVDQNKWYTLETVIGGKTYLAQYTNAWGFELKEGRGSHYTNDFLWTPIGDPYGFQLMNRYMDVNSGNYNLGEKNRAITTIPTNLTTVGEKTTVDGAQVGAFDNQKQIVMGNYVADERVVRPGNSALPNMDHAIVMTNSIYELLEGSTSGYFRVHPVANTSEQNQVYFNPEWADDDGDGVDNYLVRLKTTAAEFTFGLSAELMKPYFDRAGYVGGLKESVYNDAANASLVAAMKKDEPQLTSAQLMAAQALVYNTENIVPFGTGYYRLHSPLGISGIDPARYVSGYTHKTELTNEIPMHFYEEDSDRLRQFTDFKDGGFTSSPATRGDLTILPVERDPASIFYFQKANGADDYPGSVTTDADKARYNLGYVSTQGLYIKGTVDKGTQEDTGVRAKAVMTANALPTNAQSPTSTSPTPLFVMDLGGGVLLIHDNHTDNGRSVLKYLSYDYSNDTPGNPTIYDMKLTNHTHTDHAKFCMQPVQDSETKGINEMPLRLNMNNGGDGYYYATFCAPFDVLLTDKDNDAAYICKVWDTEILHLKKMGKYNTVANGCPAAYRGNDRFVPAGTPVIVRSKNSSVTMALPTTEPSTALANSYKSTDDGKPGNIFSGVFLEQLLAYESGSDASNNDVYVFGLPFKGDATKHASYYTSGSADNGRITISLPQHEESGVGFYINANYNRETSADMGSWLRNNRYVLGNRIYYRTPGGGGASARQQTRGAEFIPVVFDDDEDEDGNETFGRTEQLGDGYIYDLQGRRIGSVSLLKDRSNILKPGIYIVNGKKIIVKQQ